MKSYNFHAALAHLHMHYDMHLDKEEFEDLGLHAWDKIGNKRTCTYLYSCETKNKQVELPCNVDIVELVTSDIEDYNTTGNKQRDNYTNMTIENTIETEKTNTSKDYMSGKIINYTLLDNVLLFRQDYPKVNILYKGVILDEDGLPYLNFKEVEAIANYCAWVETNKKAMITKDKGTFEIAIMLRQEWVRSCADARTPIYLNQNVMNEILEAKNSWDRKRFSVSFKSSSY
jgi:hypothetical protein